MRIVALRQVCRSTEWYFGQIIIYTFFTQKIVFFAKLNFGLERLKEFIKKIVPTKFRATLLLSGNVALFSRNFFLN